VIDCCFTLSGRTPAGRTPAGRTPAGSTPAGSTPAGRTLADREAARISSATPGGAPPPLESGGPAGATAEAGQWVIIDYKTDAVPPGKARETAQKHKAQLDLYSAALTALTGLPVKARYIHLLAAGESVEV